MKAFGVPIQSDIKPPKNIGFGVTNRDVYETIKINISMHYQLTPGQYINTSRKMGICEARQVMQYFMRVLTTYSLPEIGFYCGKLDHADVVHNVKKIENLCSVYPSFKRTINLVEFNIKEGINEIIRSKLAS